MPMDLAVGDDGVIWFASPSDHRIGRFTPDGTTTFFDAQELRPRYLTVGPDGDIWAVDIEAGVIRMTPGGAVTPIDADDVECPYSPTAGADGNIWIADRCNGHLAKISPSGDVTMYDVPGARSTQDLVVGPDGDVWFVDSHNRISRVTSSGVVSIIGQGAGSSSPLAVGSDGNVWSIGGTVAVRMTTSGVRTSFSVPDAGRTGLVLGTDGALWSVSTTSQTLHRLAMDGTTTTVAAPGLSPPWGGETRAIVAGTDGHLWVSHDASATITRVTLTGQLRPYSVRGFQGMIGLGVGPDGSLWATGGTEATIGRVTTDGTVHAWNFGGSHYFHLVTGPDGNVWATKSGTISRISPSGEVTHYPVAPSPHGLAVGPDNAVWAVAEGKLFRVTTSGAPTEIPIAELVKVHDLTTGPDGNLWIPVQDALLRVTTAGDITSFPTPGTQNSFVTVGPDHNVWAGAPDSLFRVTPAGTVTEFPAVGLKPRDLVSGADGNLWVARSGGSVARVTPTGGITYFNLPGVNDSVDIVSAPDGNVWVTSLGTYVIARVAVPSVAVDLEVDESDVQVGDQVHAHVTVTNSGPTELSGVTVGGMLPACHGDVPDLAPGEDHTIDCAQTVSGHRLGDVGVTATVDTTETQPKTSSADTVTVHGGITGTVTETGTGEPIGGAWVIALDGHTHQPAGAAVADEAGHYELHLPAGDYKLEFWDPTGTHRFEYFDDEPTPDTLADIPAVTLTTSAPTVVDADLAPITVATGGNAIEGTVTDTNGEPLVGVHVAAAHNGTPVLGTRTDEDGHCRLEGLTSDAHVAIAIPPDGTHQHQFWPGDPNPMAAQSIAPTPAGTTADFTLPIR